MASETLNYFTGNGTYKVTNPIITNVGDYTSFYIAIAICTTILGSIIILNIVCCCSRYSDYWLDSNTGNRLIVSIWSATPHKQPPLDLTELDTQHQPDEYHKIHRVEIEIPPSVSRQPLTSSHDYLELHKRESDI